MTPAPWDYAEVDAPPQVIVTLLGWPLTDQFVVTFLWFGGLVFLCWAVVHKVLEDDGPRAG